MITAWQISSTMDKMQQFIRFIEQFDYQRQKLQKLLPVIQRIKRISQQKQFLSKQLLELQQTHVIPQGNNNNSSSVIKQNTTATAISSLNKKLTKISQDISKQQDENIKEINKLRRQSDNKLNIQEKQLLLRRQKLLKQLDGVSCVVNKGSSKLKQILQQLKQQQQMSSSPFPLLPQTLPNNSITSNIYTKHIDQEINSLINLNILNDGDDNNNTYKIAQPIYTRQLYELKCKLASLSDRRRKLTVKRLFNFKDNNINNTNIMNMNKYQYQYQVQQSSPKYQIVQQQYQQKDRQRSQQNDNNSKGFLNSIMAMFSSSTTQSNQNNTSHKKDNQYNQKNQMKKKQQQKSVQQKQFLQYQHTTTNPYKQIPNKQTNSTQYHNPLPNHLPSLHDIDDIEVRLKLSQIVAQIYQFRQDINVIVQENLIVRLKRMVDNLEIVNKEIECYQQELLKVGRVVKQQLLGNKSNNNNKYNILNLLQQNPQLQFFTQFINKNIIYRHKILHSIFTCILPSIPPITTFLTKRLIQLTTISQQFELTNRSKYSMKLKSTICKRQFQILTKQIEEIKGYLNECVLVRIKQVENVLIQSLRMYVQQIRDSLLMVGCNMVQQQQQIPQQQQIQHLLQLLLKTNNNNNNNYQHLITTVQQQLTINSLLQRICQQQQQNTQNNSNKNLSNKKQQPYYHYHRMQLFYQKLSNTYQSLGSIIISV